MKIENKKKILTIEAIRAIAFLFVIVHHSGLRAKLNYGGGPWAVSIFFVLSGFVAYISQEKKEAIKPGIVNYFKYALDKIKKLYPLYVLSIVALVPFYFVGTETMSVAEIVKLVILNLLLIQEWFPLKTRSINGPSWFLCPLFLSYFMFPWIYEIINRKPIKRILLYMGLLYIIQIAIGVIGFNLPKPVYQKDMMIEYDIVYWFVYRFPLSRLADIIKGNLLGKAYSLDSGTTKNATGKELMVIVVSIALMMLSGSQYPEEQFGAKIPSINYNRWWTYSIIYTPVSVLLIYLFAKGQGKISTALVNKTTLYLSKISTYGFLIHRVVFHYISAIVQLMFKSETTDLFLFYHRWYINLTVGFVITIFCSEIWIRMEKRYMSVNGRRK